MILPFNKSSVLIRDLKLQIFLRSLNKFTLLRYTRTRFSLHVCHGTMTPDWVRTCWMEVGQWQPQWIRAWSNTCYLETKLPEYEAHILTCDGLTVPLRWHHSDLRRSQGLLAVTSRNLIPWIIRLPCGRRNFCDHSYRRQQDNTIKEIQTVDHRTVRWQHDLWLRHYLFKHFYAD